MAPNTSIMSTLWWATRNEWLGLIDVAGLELVAVHGGFAGEPLTDGREYVFVTRRPDRPGDARSGCLAGPEPTTGCRRG